MHIIFAFWAQTGSSEMLHFGSSVAFIAGKRRRYSSLGRCPKRWLEIRAGAAQPLQAFTDEPRGYTHNFDNSWQSTRIEYHRNS